MSTYRIVCTIQEPGSESHDHARIVSVGIGIDPNITTQSFKLNEVIQMINNGDTFYTKGTQSGKTASVEKYWCEELKKYCIRSVADSVKDNNLDYLRECN